MRAHLLASYTARTDMTQVLAPPGFHVWGVPRTSPAAVQFAPRVAPAAYNLGRLKSASTVSYPFQPQDKALASRPSLGMASVGSSAQVAFPPPVPPSAYNIGRLPNSSVRSYPIGAPPSEENSERVLAESAAAGIDVSATKPARNVDPNTVLAKIKALMEGDVDANELATLGEYANRLRIYAAMSKIRALNPTEQAAVDEIDREVSVQVTALATEDAAKIEGKYNLLREAEAEIQANQAVEALVSSIIANPDVIREEISAKILRDEAVRIGKEAKVAMVADIAVIEAEELQDLEAKRADLRQIVSDRRVEERKEANAIRLRRDAEKNRDARAALAKEYIEKNAEVDASTKKSPE